LPLEESRPRYDEAVDILELAFSKERFSYDGEHKVKDVRVVPRPPETTVEVHRGTSDITYQRAGKGLGYLRSPSPFTGKFSKRR
jgi:alkanesulfonate monooxygenase SsuD/methylene tetrahydromethanopterin reductase-like flavin-dependent oxidoreductase (luciferase family)